MSPDLWELPQPKSLLIFQGFLTLLQDLHRTKVRVQEAAAALQAEYARLFPTFRLVLYLKNGIYPYWGHFLSSGTIDRVLLGPGSRPRAWIRQLGTDLTRDMIGHFGEVTRSNELHEFNRRAAALRRGRNVLTRAEQSIRMTLVHSDRRCSEPSPLPILPDAVQAELPKEVRKHLGYAWRLSLDAEAVEQRMAALAKQYRSRKASRALALKALKSYSHLPDAARWFVHGRLLSDTAERLSHRFLWNVLRLPRRSRGILLDFDRARRRILQDLLRFERAYRRITGIARSALPEA